jgi:GNAT superfamily N-acetyltransferase
MPSSIDDLTYRRATLADAPAVAALAAEGFATYLDFAPVGWRPPTAAEALGPTEMALGHESAWCLLAEDGAALCGHVAFSAARDSRVPSDDDTLAHLWQLFVAPRWWVSGLAVRLMNAAVEAAREQGFAHIRLWTPGDQRRARRFYEREGWTAPRPPEHDPVFGIATVEYVRDLS